MKSKLLNIFISSLLAFYFTSSIVYLMPDAYIEFIPLITYIFIICMTLLYVRSIISNKKIVAENTLLIITFVIFFIVLYISLIARQIYMQADYIPYGTLFYELLIITIIPLVLILWYLEIKLFNLNYKSITITNTGIKDSSSSAITIVSESKNKELNLDLNDLILVEAQDNYCKLYFIDKDGKTSKTIFRLSLKKMYEQVENLENIYRCHRSFIINKNKIKDISGRSQNYKISLEGVKNLIPVSRNFDIELLK